MTLALDPVEAPHPAPPPASAAHVVVGGWVRTPLQLSHDDLMNRRPLRVDDFQVVCTADGPHPDVRRLLGVPLAPLLHEAVPAFEARTDFKRVVVVAESREGYRALFSWAELCDTAIGDGVLVAWADRTAATRAHDGAFMLISRHDRHTGPRFVRDLALVQLVRLW